MTKGSQRHRIPGCRAGIPASGLADQKRYLVVIDKMNYLIPIGSLRHEIVDGDAFGLGRFQEQLEPFLHRRFRFAAHSYNFV